MAPIPPSAEPHWICHMPSQVPPSTVDSDCKVIMTCRTCAELVSVIWYSHNESETLLCYEISNETAGPGEAQKLW